MMSDDINIWILLDDFEKTDLRMTSC